MHAIKPLKFCCCLILFFSSFTYAVPRLYVYPDSGVSSILSLIKSAHRSIDVVMYGFTDKRIFDALAQANQRGVAVRVMLQKNPYKAEGENNFISDSLKKANMQFKWTNPRFDLTHQKTMIIDQKQALIMSFNFTRSTFQLNRNFAILTSSKSAVSEIENVFNADWERKSVTVSDAALIWSPENALKKIVNFISNTKATLRVYNQEMSDYQVVASLAAAARKGVQVQVIVPYANRQSYRGKLNYLQCHGVDVRLDKAMYIHAKAMLADFGTPEDRVFVGSMNFSPSGLTKNRELGAFVTDSGVSESMQMTFQHDWLQSLPFRSRCWYHKKKRRLSNE